MFNFFKRNRTLDRHLTKTYWPMHVRAGDRICTLHDNVTYQMTGAHSFETAADLKVYLQSVIWKPMDMK